MPMSKKKYNEVKAIKPKDPIPKSARKMAKVSPRVAKMLKSQSKKSLARKVVSKLGLAGKAAVGLSIGYDIIKGVKPQKQGSSCSSGHRTVKNGGQTFCISNAKIKKAKMKTTNRATPDIKSKR
jgi:hypothetical protein